MLAGIEERTKDLGYFILVYNIQTIEDVIAVQKNWKFEGFIFVGVLAKKFDEIQREIPEETPVVFVDTHFSNSMKDKVAKLPQRFFISSADEKVGYDATRYVLEQGHRNIGFLSFNFDVGEAGVINERFTGYLRALKKYDLQYNKELIFTDQEFGRNLGK